jgi:hypothetical protein
MATLKTVSACDGQVQRVWTRLGGSTMAGDTADHEGRVWVLCEPCSKEAGFDVGHPENKATKKPRAQFTGVIISNDGMTAELKTRDGVVQKITKDQINDFDKLVVGKKITARVTMWEFFPAEVLTAGAGK